MKIYCITEKDTENHFLFLEIYQVKHIFHLFPK